MEQTVKYLIRSVKNNQVGFAFMDEVEMGDHEDMGHSSILGLLIPENIVDKFNENFYKSINLTIKAVDNGNEQILPMNHVNNNLFSVNTPYGVCYFIIKHHAGLNYIGGKFQNVKLAFLEPLDMMKLEELCLNNKFFFVGEK